MLMPSELKDTFRIAKTHDIRSWSYGVVTQKRRDGETYLDNVKGTLNDQRIFGPIHDHKCACGMYSGEDYANMVCDICGVKVAPASIRFARFGHIDFPDVIPHPLDPKTMLKCFPVMPAEYLWSATGQQLQELYEQLVEASGDHNQDQIMGLTTAIAELLTPTVVLLHNWNVVPARETFARGVALHRD